MAKTQIVAEPGLPNIEINREFDAPREFLYKAHIDPELLKQWLGPRGMTMVIDKYEVRHGGEWRFIHRDANGSEYGFRGVFHGTPSLDGIVRTFEFEGAPGHISLERATFQDRDGKTLVRTTAVFETVEARDAMIASGMESGMNEGMERLDELIAKQAPIA
jgi:uncharacterized protein YndB with AHSA1/START domain